MARSRETKIELTAYDDLFQTDESREEAKLSKIRDIPISEIDEFPDHPFKVLMDEDMEQLVESIKRNGVMTPATVRLKEDGRYELISGHRRKKACELAGLETLKCEVKELTRDEAIIVMVESNLQRSVILPSEKAFEKKVRAVLEKNEDARNDDMVLYLALCNACLNYMGTPPTLQDFREELLKQNEPEAQEIALAIELFTDGSLNTFAKHTNVDTHSRLICYDILDLGKQLQPIGMLVVLDSILNRITQNRAKGRNTFIFIDEIYLLFQHEYSANFLFTLWKRVRKYGAYCTGITQNVDDLLQSHTARTMLANSEFIIMLNQASTDRLELAKLLNISDLQMSYITNVGAGQGLLKVGSSLVPFVNKFPRNTELYKLMTTKFGEV